MSRFCLFALFIVGACAADASNKQATTQSDELSPRFGGGFGYGLPNNLPFLDPSGFAATYNLNGSVDLTDDFFRSFGINGRTCGSCHKPDSDWTVSLTDINLTFDFTFGLDPIFRTVDGTNTPNADVSTLEDRRSAYSMLLTHGTIRVGIGMPDPTTSDFTLTAVDDPYNYASAAQLSLFRRPLPATNLEFIPVVMWDGRVTGTSLDDALGNQANAATEGHAQSPVPLPAAAETAIVDFETSNFTAQVFTFGGGPVTAGGATGGPENIASQTNAAGVFDLFDAWATSNDPYQQSVYRGQTLFNTQKRTTGGGPCNGCHSTQNVGTNANGTFFNIDVAAAVNRTAEYPLYTFTQVGTGTVTQVSDPGRALISGQFKDLGKFKVPGLRGVAARSPYFHNGSEQTLLDVVRFYENNLDFSFTAQNETDLVNFLQAL
jgi:cytochrome c peroxidase